MNSEPCSRDSTAVRWFSQTDPEWQQVYGFRYRAIFKKGSFWGFDWVTLEKFAQRCLDEPYPYVILDARYERVREDGAVARLC